MRKLLFLSNSPLSSKGGIQSYRKYLIDFLIEKYEIHFFSRGKEIKKISNLKTFSIDSQHQIPKIFNIFIFFIKIIINKYDYIIINHVNYSIFAIFLKILLKKNIILLVYGIDVINLSLTNKIAIRYFDLVISHSNHTKTNLLKNFNSFNKYIACIGGPYEFKKSHNITKTNNNYLVISSVTRLSKADKYKNIDKVMSALSIVKKSKVKFIYNIVGNGDYSNYLKKLAKKYKIEKNIIFHGWISDDRKNKILSETDYYILPSDGEGFGLSFIEAANYGSTVIGSITDGSREALLYGKLGFLVDPNQPNLSQIIADIIIKNKRLKVNKKILFENFEYEKFKSKIRYALNKLNNRKVLICKFDSQKNKVQSINNVSHGLADILFWKTDKMPVFLSQNSKENTIQNLISKYIVTPYKFLISNFTNYKTAIFTDQALAIYKYFYYRKKIIFCHDVINNLIIKKIIKTSFKLKKKFIYKINLNAIKDLKIIYSSKSTKRYLDILDNKKKNKLFCLYPIYHLLSEKIIFEKNIFSNFKKNNKINFLIITSNSWYKRDDQIEKIINCLSNEKFFFNIISLNKTDIISNLEKSKNTKVFYSPNDFEKNLIISKSNFLIFNSDYEGFGLPILEALKYGLIVFCKKNKHFPEIYKNNLIYYDIKKLNLLKNEIHKIIRNKSIKQKLSFNSKITYKNIIQKFENDFKRKFLKLI